MLRIADFLPGDILLKYNDGSFVNRVISTGLAHNTNGQWQDFTHAAIYLKGGCVVEAGGSGLHLTQLLMQHRICYLVFRHNNNAVRQDAASVADNASHFHSLNPTHTIHAYSVMGALRSAFNRQSHPSNRFFCSQFVAHCIQVAEKMNNLPLSIQEDPSRLNPVRYYQSIVASSAYTYVGHFQNNAH